VTAIRRRIESALFNFGLWMASHPKLPIETAEQAAEKLAWYLCRWQIEIYFRILKSGCKVEEMQLQTLERLEPALAFYKIIAWRVLYLTMLGRECPELSCNLVFADEEWQAIYIVVKRQPPPADPPSLDTMVRMVAGFGGFLLPGLAALAVRGRRACYLKRARDWVNMLTVDTYTDRFF